MQSVVDKAASVKLSEKTEESITEFLISPLLVAKEGRSSFVLKPKAKQSTPSPRIFPTAAATVARKPSSPPRIEFPID
jgi:hypothetical protein